MNSQRLITFARWFGATVGLAAIVGLYARLLHVNQTTVALTFLLFILFLATRWELRYAIVTSLAATACYNFFFLPPLHTFTVADPENFIALLVFLITSVVASRMSERIRDETRAGLVRQSELEILYSLSRSLLQTEELSLLTNSIPATVAIACRAQSAVFFLLQGERSYRYGTDWPTPLGTAELRAHTYAVGSSSSPGTGESIIPLRTGVRPRGVLLLRGISLSDATLEAVGGLVSVSLDRARAVEEVTRAEAAKESERLRTLMMDSIIHEIRGPVNAIKSAVSALRSTSPGPFLSAIDGETARLDHFVAQSVEMAQLDTLEVTMSITPQPLEALIQRGIELSAFLAGHPLTITLAPHLPRVEADPAWIPKLLANLLENAGKYSQPGQPIFISAELRNDMVACSVADRGIGIEPYEQALIFDKFYRSRDQAISGSGIGLAICRAIAQAHGGTLDVTSQPGQGSVFTFTLRPSA